ncbi:MAG: hypothetical protein BWK80_30580, partial [Desulfobacteraceae bacterium IS3]
LDIFGNKRLPPLFIKNDIKTDIKIGLAKDAESAKTAKLLKTAESDIFCLSSFALSASFARTFFLFPKMSIEYEKKISRYG